MRESFMSGSVGRALRKQCLYPEAGAKNRAAEAQPFCPCENLLLPIDIKILHVYYTCKIPGGACNAKKTNSDHRRGGL
jgi:hypothetical protein